MITVLLLFGLPVILFGLGGAGAAWIRAQRLMTDARSHHDLALREAATGTERDPDTLDVRGAARAVMEGWAWRAARHMTRLSLAAEPGLQVGMRADTLRAVLHACFDATMEAATGGHVLLTACRSGGRVQITVSGDGVRPRGDAELAAALREATQTVAMHGGTFEIDSRPDAGTTLTIRLLEGRPSAAPPTAETATQAPAVPVQQRAVMPAGA